MATGVKLSKRLVNLAKEESKLQGRAVLKQIEYWANVGRIAEDNPGLNYEFIRKILQATEDLSSDFTVTYLGRVDNGC